MAFSALIQSIELGLIFAVLSLGLFIAFRVLNLPDLTVDGSFVTGLAYSAVWTVEGNPVTGIVMGVLGGTAAGVVTGILHTKLKIHEILAGILTMTGLYSINLMIMGLSPTINFYGKKTVFTFAENKLLFNGTSLGKLVFLLFITLILVAVIYIFLKTQIGLSLRATGDNEAMVRSSSINTDAMKILGFAMCNAIVAFSGALYAQYNGNAAHSVGVGMLVLALASIIIGEAVVGRRGILRNLIAVCVGAVIYRIMLAKAYQLGLPVTGLKLFSAVMAVAAISLPLARSEFLKWRKRHAGNKKS
ncbi:ABC transporter permease [Johnsonella ignava]|mgnify:FL=1|uniref:ABC transporter permease n=1 Tax=Johnsonella ignava TaxID=43995 RepID=UPI0023F06B2D|nr:ABC transporter permease [Johnsonella ignava]